MNRSKLIFSSALSAIVTVVLLTVLTIVAEVFPVLKEALVRLSGHHWISKSLLSLGVYFAAVGISYVFSPQPTPSAIRKSIYALTAVIVLCYIALLGFFLKHYL